MNLAEILAVAKKTSKERGAIMYIIFDGNTDSYGFTQEKNLFMYDSQKMVYTVDGDIVEQI